MRALNLTERRLSRERRARLEAEALLEQKSLALYAANQQLRTANATLEERVRERTRELAIARDAALAASRAKSAFLANMSHELRTPLNAIIGFSDVIARQLFGRNSPKYTGYAQHVFDSGKHLLDLINTILDLSKIESGKHELIEEEIDLSRLIETCRVLISDRAQSGRVELRFDLAEAWPTIRADETNLKQILLNLLSNAVKFTPPGGQVRVTASRTGDGDLLIRVADTGIGMTDDEIQTALEPFGQVRNEFTRTHEGTGLGLPLSKLLIERHGGRLTVESTKGKGTIVTVILPAHRLVRRSAAGANSA